MLRRPRAYLRATEGRPIVIGDFLFIQSIGRPDLNLRRLVAAS